MLKMESTVRILVCVAAFSLVFIKGQTLTLQGSSSAVLAHGHQFLCAVSNSGALKGTLSFVRDGSNLCTVNTAVCTEFSSTPGYNCGCEDQHGFFANISSVSRDDKGSWTCQYSGTRSNSLSLDVYYSPTINIPGNKDVAEHADLKVDCGSRVTPGNPSDVTYAWLGPDGYSMPGAVLVRNVTRDHRGRYTCTATNSAGLSDTASIEINVQYAPNISSLPTVFNVTENSSPDINCSSDVTPGNPPETNYRWTGPGGYSVAGAVLRRNMSRNEGGQYTCIATNNVGLSDTALVNVNVKYLDPPVLTVSPSHVMEKGSVEVVCNVTSNPLARMTIRKSDNTTLVDHELTNSFVHIQKEIQCLQSGTLRCRTFNEETSQTKTASADLSVSCAPRWDHRKIIKNSIYRGIGETAAMTVHAIANPLPNFTWWKYRDGQLEPISEHTVHKVHSKDLQSTLQITVTHVGDYGTYAVEMRNDYGESVLLYTLSPVSAPLTPDKAIIDNVTTSTAFFQWRSNYDGGSEQTFTVDYRPDNSEWTRWRSGIPDPGKGEITGSEITGLKQGTKYQFQVYAQNVYGTSDKVTRDVVTRQSDGSLDALTEDHLGKGVGIGVGITLPVSLVVTYLLCKKKPTVKDVSTASTPSKYQKTACKTVCQGVRSAGGQTYEEMDSSLPAIYESIESPMNVYETDLPTRRTQPKMKAIVGRESTFYTELLDLPPGSPPGDVYETAVSELPNSVYVDMTTKTA